MYPSGPTAITPSPGTLVNAWMCVYGLRAARLGFAEKAIALALRAPYGDFRDWQDIQAWASAIADDLRSR
jgi:hypothetical protein